ncbi:hypothetical protein E4U52_006594 [Claviceps spartinae]|nr:hypothetical protein E4U52_006594 [Claviceps spartinae]
MDAMQTYLYETEFENIIGPIEELEEDEESLHKTFEPHLLSCLGPAEASSVVCDSTAAAQLPTVHEQAWRNLYQQEQLGRVAALSVALPIVNDHVASRKILQELGEVSTSNLKYVSPDEINLTIPEYC